MSLSFKMSALLSAIEEESPARPGTIRHWKTGDFIKQRDGSWTPVPVRKQPPMKVIPASTPMKPAPQAAAQAAPAAHDVAPGADHKGGAIKHALGHAWHMATDPFVKGYKLATDKKYRGEIKDWVKGIAAKEKAQTKQLVGSLGKVAKGEKLSKQEKDALVDQVADVVKMGVGAAVLGHFVHGGVENLAALLSPLDEMVGIALDGPLRKATKAVFGREHGLLPTSFYEQADDGVALLDKIVDAVLDELAKNPPSDADLEAALAAAGVDPSKAETLRPFLKGSQQESRMYESINEFLESILDELGEDFPAPPRPPPPRPSASPPPPPPSHSAASSSSSSDSKDKPACPPGKKMVFGQCLDVKQAKKQAFARRVAKAKGIKLKPGQIAILKRKPKA